MNLQDARRIVRRHARTGVAVDTNLLLLLWVGAMDPAEVRRFKRTEKYGHDGFPLLYALLGSVSRLVTTPHVLAEVSNLTGERHREAFVSSIVACDERLSDAAKLVSDDSFPRLGMTDIALTELARNGVLVLTDDLPLYLHISCKNWPVLYFTHIRGTLLIQG